MASDDKYDRQLRLWGAAGQRALGSTCVVLVRATAAGTETCKNLVLPGVGAIFVADDQGCDARGCASNFFLAATDSGSSGTKSRAEVAVTLLQELNPDVRGSWKHCDDLLDLDLAATLEFARTGVSSQIEKLLVVGSDLEPPLLLKVAAACDAQRVPLLAVHSYGLLGVVRLQATEPLPLLEPRPRDSPPDLRLARPFPRLRELAATAYVSDDWSQLDNAQHGRIPYPLILLRVADRWRAERGRLPASPAEKEDFRAAVRAAARDFDAELNFQEAVRFAYLAYAPRELDRERLADLRERAAGGGNGSSSSSSNNSNLRGCAELYILLRALDQFLQAHDGQPPVSGSLPDMTAATDLYVRLQAAYRDQAAADAAEMKRLVRQLVAANSSVAAVPEARVEAFCKNVFTVDLLQTRSLADEYSSGTTADDELCEDLAMATMEGDERPDQIPLLWYLGFRACQSFYAQHGRYPGTSATDDYRSDAAPLQQCLDQIVQSYRLQDNELVQSTLLAKDGCDDDGTASAGASKYAVELARYGNAEIHNIASVVGGVASEEAVKVITGQYVPLNHTYIYNGIASTGAVYKF